MKRLIVTILLTLSMITVWGFLGYAHGNGINGCYQKKNGQLRIVANPNDCLPSEEAISWNVSGYTKTFTVTRSIAPNNLDYISVQCDGYDYVTGCSYSLDAYSESMSNYHFLRVMPDVCGSGGICRGCRVGLYNSSASALNTTYSVYAYCGNAP